MRTEASLSTFRDLVVDALPSLEKANDSRGLQRAWQLLASTHLYDEQMEAMAVTARKAAAFAQAAGWPPRQSIMILGGALVHGPTPLKRAIKEVEALCSKHHESRDIWSVASTAEASLMAMANDQTVAAELMTAVKSIHEDHGDRLALLTHWTPNRLTQLRLKGDA